MNWFRKRAKRLAITAAREKLRQATVDEETALAAREALPNDLWLKAEYTVARRERVKAQAELDHMVEGNEK